MVIYSKNWKRKSYKHRKAFKSIIKVSSISKYTQNPKPIKEKNDKHDFIKIRSSCMAKIFLQSSKKMTTITKKPKVKKKSNQRVRKIFQLIS